MSTPHSPSPVPAAERTLAKAQEAFKQTPNKANAKRLEDAQRLLKWAKDRERRSN